MQAACDSCGKKTTLPTDDWGVACSSCDYLLLCPVGPGKKYFRSNTEQRSAFHHFPETDVMVEYKGIFYAFDNKVVETRTGQEVYGTIPVEGIVKERLEELLEVRKKLKTAEGDLQQVRPELEEAKEDIRDKDNALGVMRTELESVYFTLEEKETSLNRALGKVKDCEAEFGREMVKKAAMMTEMETKMEKKIQAAEDRAKKAEEELGLFRQNENGKVAKKEEMAREMKELQEALSAANNKLEDAAIMTDFRRQESLKNEQLRADQKTFFIEYKLKMEQKMAETTKFYQDQIADQEKRLLEQKDQLQKNMEGQAKYYEQQMTEKERTFLEKQDKMRQEMDEAKEGIRDKDNAPQVMRTTLAEKETALDEALRKVKEMEKVAKLYKKKMIVLEKGFLKKQGKIQQDMDDMRKDYEQQKDSLQKKVEEMQKNCDDQMTAVSATNAKLEKQNEIFIKTIANLSKTIDKLTESVGSSKAKDGEKTAEREKKGEGW